MKKVSIKIILATFALCFISPIIAQNEIQRVRVNLETPLGYTRQLLLGFTPDNAASDGVDYGYDGPNIDNFPDDFSWLIEDDKYIIQGVGAFDETKKYPIGFFLSNSGNINITLNSLENFESEIEVFVYDKLNDSYHEINDSIFNLNMSSGEYPDRFYIAFSNPSLSIDEHLIKGVNLSYSRNSGELKINTLGNTIVKGLKIYNLYSQEVFKSSLSGGSETVVSLSNNYLGIHIISIETNNGSILKKILL